LPEKRADGKAGSARGTGSGEARTTAPVTIGLRSAMRSLATIEVSMGTQRQKAAEPEPQAADRTRPKAADARGRGENGKARGEEFLRAALDLFAERNFASVTIKDIGQALGVNTALIYYYFESKTDLFRATIEFAVENAFDSMRALDEKSGDPAKLISAWLQNHVDKYAKIHRFVKIALDYRSSHEGDPSIEASIAKFYAKEREMLSRCIRQGIEQGIFKPVDPARMAAFISTYLDGCMVRLVILPDYDLKAAVADLHRIAFESLGYGARAKPRRR
jgi:AcrR family transcriptional regulator